MILNRVAAFIMSLYGSRHGYDYYNELERITHVAIMYKGVMYTKEKPHRHHHIIKDMVDVHKLPKGLAGNVQGFMTSRGRFVDRTEAAVIARNANQLIRPIEGGKLFSEEVW